MNAHNVSFPKLLFALMITGLILWPAPVAQNAPLATAVYAGWEEVAGSATGGGISNFGAFANVPSLAFDHEGRPVVAWNGNLTDNPEVYLKRLEGSTWVEIGGSATGGGISKTATDSGRVSLAIGADGQPVVAWREALSDGNTEIYVKRWSGSAWVGMNGAIAGDNISGTGGESILPVLAIGSDGHPVVAWTEFTTNYEIYVKKWNGSSWLGLAGSATGGGISTSAGESRTPSLAINNEGNPVVAWSETPVDSDSDIYVKRWNGTAWVLMKVNGAATDDISQNTGGSYRPSLAISASGEIAVAWEDDSGPGDDFDIYVKRWTGLTWNRMGVQSDSGGGISANDGPSYWVSLSTTPDGSWIVSWEDSSEGFRAIYFRIYNGSGWLELESGSATTGGGVSGFTDGYRSTRPSLASSPDGTLMVAWERDGDTTSEIHARRYQPPTYGGWQEVAGSATGGGISNNPGSSIWSSLAFAGGGAPIVAWHDNQSGISEIYVRTEKGSGWVGMDGTANSVNVSNSPEVGSFRPSLAIDKDGQPIVAWRENTGDDTDDPTDSNWEIYLKRWNGSAWVAMGTPGSLNVSNTNGVSESPWLAIDDAGRPVVAWVETPVSGNREIYLVRWNGSNWAPFGTSNSGGGISNSAGDSFRPSVAIDKNGFPVVAWSEVHDSNNGLTDIYVRHWTGSNWGELGVGSAVGSGVSGTDNGSFRPSLAINPDGLTVVAWEDGCDVAAEGCEPENEFEIYAKRYDAATNSWKEIGEGSASGGGISDNNGNSNWPSLAIDPDGVPIIAWEDYSNGQPEIYFRRFNGLDWVDLAPGSARLSGVSGAPSGSRALRPSLAADADGRMMVAWENVFGVGEADIFARDFNLCFPLTLSHTGQGLNPTAAPANSSGCSPGEYKAGEEIALTAAPGAGWGVSGWSGTNTDGSEEKTNTLIMPGRSHTVGVQYKLIPIPVFLPSITNLTLDCLNSSEREPNNYAAFANKPLCPDAKLQGRKNNDDDFDDFFLLLPMKSGNITATLTGNLDNVDWLVLYPGKCETVNGTETCDADIAHPVDQDSEPSGGQMNVNYSNAPAGRYYLRVIFIRDAPGGASPYTLDVVSPPPF